jgi:hypothetical protein
MGFSLMGRPDGGPFKDDPARIIPTSLKTAAAGDRGPIPAASDLSGGSTVNIKKRGGIAPAAFQHLCSLVQA